MSTQTQSLEASLEQIREQFTEEECDHLFLDIMRAALTEPCSLRNYTAGNMVEFLEAMQQLIQSAALELEAEHPEPEIQELFLTHSPAQYLALLKDLQTAAISDVALYEVTSAGEAYVGFERLREYVLREY